MVKELLFYLKNVKVIGEKPITNFLKFGHMEGPNFNLSQKLTEVLS